MGAQSARVIFLYCMLRFLLYILAGILSSFYLFPIEFKDMPGINTKMMMAAVGVCLFLYDCARKSAPCFDLGLIKIVILSFVVSFIGFLSVVLNNTHDYTYAMYFVSMFVWFGGAYTMLKTLQWAHGNVPLHLLCDYLVAVCVMQCVSALLIEYIPAFSNFVDSYVLGVGFKLNFSDLKGQRMYGIGAMLDVAGQRFSAILLIVAWLVTQKSVQEYKTKLTYYLLSFIFIVVIGDMIGRTTTVGALMAIGYWGYVFVYKNHQLRKVVGALAVILCLTLPVIIYLYNSNITFYNNTKFAFEGFFSLASTGKWETHSNNILQSMIRIPEKTSTWLIGDGYFNDPVSDPYYIGYMWKFFYMGTDIGYLRFVYYFGIFGLLAFSLYFIAIGQYLSYKFPHVKDLFWGIVLLNFVVWFKVSSDLFPILALFVLLPAFSGADFIGNVGEQRDCKLKLVDNKNCYSYSGRFL